MFWTQRYHLVFTAKFADEPVFSAKGDISIPAGREAANTIVDSLKRHDFRCSQVVQRDYYGWQFQFTYQHTKVDAILQRIDKWILTLASSFSWKNILLRRPTCSVEEVAANVAQALKSDLLCEDMSVFSDDDLPY
jgi:hypothetical protein